MFKLKLKIKNFFLLSLIGLLLFMFGSRTILAKSDDSFYVLSLNFQKLISDFFKKFLSKDENIYKEKYYELLQELAKLKMTLKNNKEIEIIQAQEKFLPQTERVKVLKKDLLGYFYISNFPNISEDMIVLDKNWVLVGKIIKVNKNYSVVESLNVPNIEFNVQNINGDLLGLARTISNEFIEVNFIDPKFQINLNDFILTDKGYFPSGFVVGSVTKVYKSDFNQKVILKTAFDSESSEFLVIKK